MDSMSPEEREQWWDRLFAETWSERNEAYEAIMSRVEELERQLAAARTASERSVVLDVIHQKSRDVIR